MKCSHVALTLVLAVLGWASTAPMAAHTLDAIATVAEENQPASETASSDDGQMEKNAEYDQDDETPTATAAEENQPANETASSDDGQMEKNAEYDQDDETPIAIVAEENQPANAEESADNCPIEHVRPSCLESADYGWWSEAQAAAKRWIGTWVVDFRTACCSISQRIARVDWAALVAGQTQDWEVRQTTPGVEPVQR